MSELNLASMLALIAGGLALFLFGLELMTASLKAVAGPGLQTALGKLTADRFRGLLVGAFVTALLNSSTITTVLLVGFVAAGLVTLNQTVPMIVGANIGSTITAQIIAFNLSAITPVILAVGFLLRAVGQRETLRQVGNMILGFGLLFLGIQFMGDGPGPYGPSSLSLAAKGRIRDLAESARESLLAKLQFSDKKDVVSFSLAMNLVEQLKQIASLARQIAEIVEERASDKPDVRARFAQQD